MLETISEALSLVTLPLGVLFLLAAFVAALIDGRWLTTTAYLEEGPPLALHWVTRARRGADRVRCPPGTR